MNSPSVRYQQMASFIHINLPPTADAPTFTEFENPYRHLTPPEHNISSIYWLRLTHSDTELPPQPHLINWKQEEKDIVHKSFTGPRSCCILENYYVKILTRWYNTPTKLNIQKFWTEILTVCTDKLKLTIDKKPAAALFYHNTTSMNLYKISLPQYALKTAKILIPSKWKSTLIQTLSLKYIAVKEEFRKFKKIHAE
ncbi:hypothetical protein XELAEV_18012824mg [Xenopus laevis]|uniref:Uncharacterized protein n=1 Tax=Xenopus laevis TaxID=8355 RepID=A0A974DPH1_XENLA|nr:hypothetical protein XELAEV_18012824mg [Xenopus laevis]